LCSLLEKPCSETQCSGSTAGSCASARRALRALLRNAALMAAMGFWLVVAVSWALNPWFSPSKHAFSDLGGPGARAPWVYDCGLIGLGALVMAYSLYVASSCAGRAEAFASGLLFTSGAFLALIGVFPSGTRPHTFVSSWFFAQFFMAASAFSAALWLGGKRREGVAIAALLAAGVLGAAAVELAAGWPSVALLEGYGVAVITGVCAVLRAAY